MFRRWTRCSGRRRRPTDRRPTGAAPPRGCARSAPPSRPRCASSARPASSRCVQEVLAMRPNRDLGFNARVSCAGPEVHGLLLVHVETLEHPQQDKIASSRQPEIRPTDPQTQARSAAGQKAFGSSFGASTLCNKDIHFPSRCRSRGCRLRATRRWRSGRRRRNSGRRPSRRSGPAWRSRRSSCRCGRGTSPSSGGKSISGGSSIRCRAVCGGGIPAQRGHELVHDFSRCLHTVTTICRRQAPAGHPKEHAGWHVHVLVTTLRKCAVILLRSNGGN